MATSTETKKKEINPKIQKTVYKLNFNTFYSLFHGGGYFGEWAFCSAPSKTGIVNQITKHTICRENLVNYLFSQFSQGPPTSHRRVINKNNEIPVNKTRIIASRSLYKLYETDKYKDGIKKETELFEQKLLKGLRILNTLEHEHKWPLTKVYRLKNETPKEYKSASSHPLLTYMFIGSSKWIVSSQMLSLFILILRSGNDIKSKFNDHDSLMKVIEKNTKTARSGNKYHIRTTYKYWDRIMANHTELFRNLKAKTNYDKRKLFGVGADRDIYLGADGITSLCRNRCKNKFLLKRFNAISKKVK